jgi:hypothetical protein
VLTKSIKISAVISLWSTETALPALRIGRGILPALLSLVPYIISAPEQKTLALKVLKKVKEMH